MRFTKVIFILLFLSGCVSPSKVMVNNQGQMVRCWASGWGWAGAPAANSMFDHCVNDYTSMGYVDISSAGYVGIQFVPNETKVAKVMLVQPGSPADKAGLQTNDLVVEVNSQPVSNPILAKQLIFGTAGATVSIKVKRRNTIVPYTLVRQAAPSIQRAPATSANTKTN